MNNIHELGETNLEFDPSFVTQIPPPYLVLS
jgi:hypothetical protein